MALCNLSDPEREIIRRCVQAAAEGPYFPDREFATIFGVSRDEVRAVLRSWPSVDETSETVTLSINNALNNLTGYPHRLDGQLVADIGVDRERNSTCASKMAWPVT